MKTAAQTQTWKIPLKPNLGDGEVEGLRRKLVPWREAFWRQSFIVSSCHPPLTLETNPGGKRRASCWTRRATLPPFCPVSQWRSRRCLGCRPANLVSDWKKKRKKGKFSKTAGCQKCDCGKQLLYYTQESQKRILAYSRLLAVITLFSLVSLGKEPQPE